METGPQPVEILAIGAHPDDIEIGCAGSLAKLTAQGRTVGLADLTRGEMGSRGSGDIRLAESHRAADILSARFRTNLGMPDTRVLVCEENEKKIVELIRRTRPRLLLVPMLGETHPDHTACAELCLSAWHKSGFGRYASPLPPFRPERIIHYMLGVEFEPSFVVDITSVIESRRQALQAYESQFHNAHSDRFTGATRLSSPDYWDKLETRVKYFGNRILKHFGEPFRIKEYAEVSDLSTLSDAFSPFKDPRP